MEHILSLTQISKTGTWISVFTGDRICETKKPLKLNSCFICLNPSSFCLSEACLSFLPFLYSQVLKSDICFTLKRHLPIEWASLPASPWLPCQPGKKCDPSLQGDLCGFLACWPGSLPITQPHGKGGTSGPAPGWSAWRTHLPKTFIRSPRPPLLAGPAWVHVDEGPLCWIKDGVLAKWLRKQNHKIHLHFEVFLHLIFSLEVCLFIFKLYLLRWSLDT